MATKYIYFIVETYHQKVKGDSCVKIGIARNPQKRLSELQTGNPKVLEVAITIGPMSEFQAAHCEAKFHTRFKKERLAGEWFTSKVFRSLSQWPKFLPDGLEIKVHRTRIGPRGTREMRRINTELAAMREAEMKIVADAKAAGL